MWAEKNGRSRKLAFEEWYPEDDGEGNANVPQHPHWASEMEVWGNYGFSDGGMVHGWIAAHRNWDAWNPALRQGCMVMASQATASRSVVLISHEPI